MARVLIILLFLHFLSLVSSINIIDLETCSIPYLIPRVFQTYCDRSDEYGTDGYWDSLNVNFMTSTGILTKSATWTREPFCLQSEQAIDGFCVYTSGRFANGRGISIVTTPKELTKVMEAVAFTTEEQGSKENTVTLPPKYEPRELPGRQIGLVANDTLYRHEMIHSHTPIAAFQDDFVQFASVEEQELLYRKAIERLPGKSRDMFHALHGQFGGNPYADRVNTNSIAARMGNANDHFGVIIPETSRLNHDCRPNANFAFSPASLSLDVYALRTILPGTEIKVSYITPDHQYSARQSLLTVGWGFTCTCTQCSLQHTRRARSDTRIRMIAELTDALSDLSSNRTATPNTAELLVSLHEEERLDGAVAEALMLAALEWSYLGEREKVMLWASKALSAMVAWKGEAHESTMSLAQMLKAPESHGSWRFFERRDRGEFGEVKAPGKRETGWILVADYNVA